MNNDTVLLTKVSPISENYQLVQDMNKLQLTSQKNNNIVRIKALK